jgi:hypothetical protein
MADALKELQIETFKKNNNNLLFNIEMNENDNEQEKEEFLLTNELKKTIELLNKESYFNKFITSYDQLQLIPYNPLKSNNNNNNNKIESSHYEVEEPLDTSNNKKNLLKR